MGIVILVLFLLTLPPIFFNIKKIKMKEDINMLDINILATFLYFIFIPVYYYFIGEEYAVDLLEDGIVTFIIVGVYIYIIYFLDIIVSKSNKCKYSLLNISYQLRTFYRKIIFFKKYHLYLIVFILSLNLYSNLFYSNLQGKNLSNADMEVIYTAQVNTADRINYKLRGIYNFFLVPIILYGIIIVKKTTSKFYKNINKWRRECKI